ncbi:MAG: SBBP repeat-containing protein, partial [Bacteroidota bacterium]
MKTRYLLFCACLFSVVILTAQQQVAHLSKNKNVIFFTENKGQVYDQYYKPRPDVLFGAMAGNMAFHLKTTGVSYQLYRVDKWKEVEDNKTKTKHKEIDQQTIYRIDLNWLNHNANFTKSTDEVLPGFNNYYLESCPDGALNVKSYKGVTLHNLYKGINLHYYEKNGELKHDYIVAPNSNYKQIQLQVKGATIQVNKDGTLLLSTPLGKVQEGAPIVYQNGKQLPAKWVIKNNTLRFDIKNYNPELELIIDPLTRLWGTYYGGTGSEEISYSTNADSNLDVYVIGHTQLSTSTIIATSGAFQNNYAGGFTDCFIAKFNTFGVRIFGTYYGGTASDYSYDCIVDASNNLFVVGRTNSSIGSPFSTIGAHQLNFAGGTTDAFITKFNGSGIRLWSTYYGGNGTEDAQSCTLDSNGDLYVSGMTSSPTTTNIATASGHQTNYGGGTLDAFVVKFNTNGTRLWGTYYGGNGDDYALGSATDPSGNLYVVGSASSNTGTVIATLGSHQSTYGGGNGDGFIVKFTSSGTRIWSSYYGGLANGEAAFSCSVDNSSNVYIVGNTSSTVTSVISTAGSHQQLFGGGGDDAFIAKFNAGGTRLWASYYGGTGTDRAYSSDCDALGNVYIVGFTDSNNGNSIATPGSYQVTYGLGSQDAFVAQFNPSGSRIFGTYYGGNNLDIGESLCLDATGAFYLAGWTNSSNGNTISSANSHQNVFGGGVQYDAFLVKFADCVSLSPTAAVNSSVCANATLNFTSTITGTLSPTYSWSGPNSFTANVPNPSITNASTLSIGVYTLTINNGGCAETATAQVSLVNPSPTIAANSGSICSGNNFTINPTGASSYTIQGGSNVVSPGTNTSYTVIGTSAAGCLSSNTATSNVTVNALPVITVASATICAGATGTLTASGASTYTWSTGSNASTVLASPIITTTYTANGTSSAGCVGSAVTATITVGAAPSIVVNSATVC